MVVLSQHDLNVTDEALKAVAFGDLLRDIGF